MELTAAVCAAGERYKKIVADTAKLDELLVELALEGHAGEPERIVLDVDATDGPLHGRQEGRFHHGYYREYVYLPLYVFWGRRVLCARLREANQDPAAGVEEELERIVQRIRERWPAVRVVLRGDSGFCRESVMAWCERHGVQYVLGLQKNARLQEAIADEQEQARRESERTGEAARVFKDL